MIGSSPACLHSGGGLAGDAVYHQLQPVADHLPRVDIHDCGHLVPLEQPQLFAGALVAFDS